MELYLKALLSQLKEAAVVIDPNTGKEVVIDSNEIDEQTEKTWGKYRGGGGVITLDYDHKNKGKNQNMHGNAGGTTTIKDIGNSVEKNGPVNHENIDYREMYNTIETPDGWEKFKPTEKAKWLIKMIRSGTISYPGGMHQESLALISNYKSLFDPYLAQCVSFTGKLPDFMQGWITDGKLKFFPKTYEAVLNQREKLPPDKQTIDYQFAA